MRHAIVDRDGNVLKLRVDRQGDGSIPIMDLRHPKRRRAKTGLSPIPLDDACGVSSEGAWRKVVDFFPAGEWRTDPAALPDAMLDRVDLGEVSVGVLNLLPSVLSADGSSGVRANLCPAATPICTSTCLPELGPPSDPFLLAMRSARSAALLHEPYAFGRLLYSACLRHLTRCKARKKVAAVRLNGSSDVPWEKIFPGLLLAMNEVRFYDYTRTLGRATGPNYRLTYAFAGDEAEAYDALVGGLDVAVLVLDTVRFQDGRAPRASLASVGLPQTLWGHEVIDGESAGSRVFDHEYGEDGAPKVVAFRRSSAPIDKTMVVPTWEIEGRLVSPFIDLFAPDRAPPPAAKAFEHPRKPLRHRLFSSGDHR